MILHPLLRFWELIRQHLHKLPSYRSSTMEYQASLRIAATFDDGTNTLDVSYEIGNYAPNPIISLGNINASNYSNFFGFTDPFAGYGDIAYVWFDIDGYSDVNPSTSSFSVTLIAIGSINGIMADSPDPDFMGVIGVAPILESSTILLLVAGLAGIAILGWKQNFRK